MTSDDVSRETPPTPTVAAGVFSANVALAELYVSRLNQDAIHRGLIGPKEAPRLWERHILNCAVVVTGLPVGAAVLDVGSGAGLPGIVWAIARPDLRVTVLDPLRRRTDFLSEVVHELGLGERVRVCRGRAEEHNETYAVVTARAVADLAKLSRLCLPLLAPDGVMIAFKGSSAQRELDEAISTIARLGGTGARVTTYGGDILSVPTTVIEVRSE